MLGANHEAEQWPEAHRRGRPDEVQARHAAFEAGIQPGRGQHPINPGPQGGLDEFQPVDVYAKAGSGDHVVEAALDLGAMAAQAQRHAAGILPRGGNRGLGERFHPAVHTVAQPPRAFGR